MGFSFFKSKDRGKQKVDPKIVAGLNGERPSNPQVSIKLAEHFLRENKRELAVDEYLNAAQCFLEKRQTQLAMAVYRNIITIDPERYSVYETLADLYLKAGFPGDCASVLLALAYQYKTAGYDSEVKRLLDSVLEVAPNNPVLKRKVQAFFAAEGLSGAAAKPAAVPVKPEAAPVQTSVPAQPPEPTPEPEVPAQPESPAKPDAAPVQTSVPAQPPEPTPESEVPAQPESPAKPDAAPVQTCVPAQSPEPAPEPEIFAQPESPAKPDAAPVQTCVPAQPPEPSPEPEIFAQPESPAKPDAAPVQTRVPAQPPEPASEPEVPAQPDTPNEPVAPDASTQSFFDLRSALATDAAPEQKSVPAQTREPDFEPEVAAQEPVAPEPSSDPGLLTQPDVSKVSGELDATARSFFDLQSALATDASLGFDYDSSSEDLLNSDQESSLFSVLNVVKDIAEQDPRQDTPLFHFNLGTAYMECGDYEQAVDEFLSALYGTSDKIGCYVRLAECSLKLQRRELACGFLREALDNPDISSEQDRNARKLLNEISAS